MTDLAIAIRLTVFGMGIVFALLGMLAALLALLTRLDARRGAQGADQPPPTRKPRRAEHETTGAAAPASAVLDAETLAAIFVAVREHRRVRRKQAAPALRVHQPGSLPSRWVGAGRTRQNRSWAPGGRYS